MVRSRRHAAHATLRAIQDLRSKVREKVAVAELARELAHELNNPLEALTNRSTRTAGRKSQGDA